MPRSRQPQPGTGSSPRRRRARPTPPEPSDAQPQQNSADVTEPSTDTINAFESNIDQAQRWIFSQTFPSPRTAQREPLGQTFGEYMPRPPLSERTQYTQLPVLGPEFFTGPLHKAPSSPLLEQLRATLDLSQIIAHGNLSYLSTFVHRILPFTCGNPTLTTRENYRTVVTSRPVLISLMGPKEFIERRWYHIPAIYVAHNFRLDHPALLNATPDYLWLYPRIKTKTLSQLNIALQLANCIHWKCISSPYDTTPHNHATQFRALEHNAAQLNIPITTSRADEDFNEPCSHFRPTDNSPALRY